MSEANEVITGESPTIIPINISEDGAVKVIVLGDTVTVSIERNGVVIAATQAVDLTAAFSDLPNGHIRPEWTAAVSILWPAVDDATMWIRINGILWDNVTLKIKKGPG